MSGLPAKDDRSKSGVPEYWQLAEVSTAGMSAVNPNGY